jgi:hypothetical protein
MYNVVEIDDKICYSERTFYRSAVAADCWNFIQHRLTHHSALIRNGARKMVVIDGAGQFVDPPYEINVLRKAA